MPSHHTHRLGTFAVAGCLLWPSLAVGVDPPFNDKFELKGSAAFNRTDWHVHGEGTTAAGAKVSLAASGLLFKLDSTQASAPRVQFKRSMVVGDGVAWAWFRITIDDVDQVGFYAGLYSEDSDPKGSEPAYAAYFKKDESDTTVDLITRDGSTTNTEPDKVSLTDNTPFDLVVKIDPDATDEVTFYWRNSPTADWDDEPVDTNVPPDTSELHFSLLAFNDDGGGTSASLVGEIFETEAPTEDD